ncbi:uncharacterized protein LOC122071666 [Macadamia integrifolia]|uniref:uncharacterized protein LOC122071666 n=1 Tax=Macadamia integrifolia TaxID=60698 RepID=UPI001C50052F|nr:uncharacterized protein LOC122071666 [Macadamia integrifolia]
MKMKGSSITTLAPLLLRELVTSLFISADQSLINLSERYKLVQILHRLLVHTFFFFLRLLPSFLSSVLITPSLSENSALNSSAALSKSKPQAFIPNKGAGGSSIARALSQLLSLMNEIPVSSRKYQVVRSLAEKLIDENLREDHESLKEVNRVALSAAFSETLLQLEAAMSKQERRRVSGDGGSVSGSWTGSGTGPGPFSYRMRRVLRGLRSFREGASFVFAGDGGDGGGSEEKWGVELLWLAQKMADCGCVEEAEWRWGTMSNLARLALIAEPRLQGSLVKFSAFLFKQVKGIRNETGDDQHRESTMNMLTTWLPLLCRASNGVDAPVLSSREREELERVLEETIEMLGQDEEKEEVLSLWLHHFTSCPSSDWPNLQACYTRWCDVSRKLLLLS